MRGLIVVVLAFAGVFAIGIWSNFVIGAILLVVAAAVAVLFIRRGLRAPLPGRRATRRWGAAGTGAGGGPYYGGGCTGGTGHGHGCGGGGCGGGS